jgi:hypothetical protein
MGRSTCERGSVDGGCAHGEVCEEGVADRTCCARFLETMDDGRLMGGSGLARRSASYSEYSFDTSHLALTPFAVIRSTSSLARSMETSCENFHLSACKNVCRRESRG